MFITPIISPNDAAFVAAKCGQGAASPYLGGYRRRLYVGIDPWQVIVFKYYSFDYHRIWTGITLNFLTHINRIETDVAPMKKLLTVTAAIVATISLAASLSNQVFAANIDNQCVKKRNDDNVRNIPPSLSTRAAKALNVSQSDIIGSPALYEYRCMNGTIWVCNHGANITCSKANTGKHMPSVDQFCRENPSDDVVPMVVTGHDTIHSWKCVNGKPVITNSQRTDERGFIADDWSPLD